jgi:glucose-1-phosphate thymidylyltransferase
MLGKIKDILIITTPEDLASFQRVLGDGSRFGVQFTYAVQAAPRGIAEAFIIGSQFIAGDSTMLILGDNIFFGAGLSELLVLAAARKQGASVFAYQVEDPQRYGVVIFNAQNRALSIEEKPRNPSSNWAITGLYVYDNHAVEFARRLKPSARGELEITDLNNVYLERGDLNVTRMGRGYAWLDAGTCDSLLESSNFIRSIQVRQGVQIGCLEEIALQNGWIGKSDIERAIGKLKSSYAQYLERLLV